MSLQKTSLKNFLNLKLILILNLIFFDLFLSNFVYAEDLNNKPSTEYLRRKTKNNFYIIGPSDVLYVEINDFTKELNSISTVNGEGFLKLPNLNKVYVEGLTIDELSDVLNQEYSKIVKEPSVNISVMKYRPVKIVIEGEVEDTGIHILPGTYNLNVNNTPSEGISLTNVSRTIFSSNDDDFKNLHNTHQSSSESVFFPTVFEAIRKSSGITLNADLSKVKIIRNNSISNGGGKIATTVNLLETLNQKDNSQNIRIMDGDNIYIPRSAGNSLKQITKAIKSNLNSKFINIYLAGRVQNVGLIKLNRTASLTDAIEIAGAKIVKGPVKFLRYNADGSIDSRKFRYRKNVKRGDFKNPILKNGDIIYITKSPINVATEVMSEITSPFQGILSSYTIYKAFSNL